MDYVIGVSWPRSGHHLLVRLLKIYFGPDFGYCDFYGGVKDCCKTVPCRRRGEIVLTKSHDFDRKLPQLRKQKYLVQYREFIPSVVSNFELHVRNGAADTLESFRKFASTEFDRYQLFVQKWVSSPFGQTQLVIRYEDLLNDTEGCLAETVLYLCPGVELDRAKLRQALEKVDGERIEQGHVQRLNKVGVHPARRIEEFRHYRPALFEAMRNMTLSRAQVERAFSEILGRKPVAQNMIRLQAYPSVEALREMLKGSEEYTSKLGAKDG